MHPGCREEDPNHHLAANPAAFHHREVTPAAVPNHHLAVNPAACRHREVNRAAVPNHRHLAVSQEADPSHHLHLAVRLAAVPNHPLHQEAIREASLRVVRLAAVPNRLRPPEVRIHRPACTGSYHSRRHLDLVCAQRQRRRTLGCLLPKVQRVFGPAPFTR